VYGRSVARLSIVIVAVLLCVLVPATASAAPSLSAAKTRAKQLQQQVATLAAQLTTAVHQYQEATDRLALVTARVAEDQLLLAQARQDLDVAQQNLSTLAVGMYKQSPTSVLDMFVGVGSLEDLATRVRLLDSVGRDTSEVLAEAQQRRNQMVQREAQTQADQAQAGQLVLQIAKQKEQLGASLAQNKTALGKANADVKRIAKEIIAERAAAAAARAAAGGGQMPAVPLTGILGAYTQQTWARALLKNLGVPVTDANLTAIYSWEMAEGGHWYNTATFNPLNTTMSEPGATSMNSVGVKAYTSWEQGFAATISTLFNGYYAGILAALEKGDDAQAVANAVAASPWGTGSFTIRPYLPRPARPTPGRRLAGRPGPLELDVLYIFEHVRMDLFHRTDPLEGLVGLVGGHELAGLLQVVPLEQREQVVGALAGMQQTAALGAEPLAPLGVEVEDGPELVVVGDVVVDKDIRHDPAPHCAVRPTGPGATVRRRGP
jgi:peptidoglycan hydrolase CwlO-like protein